MPIVVQRGSRDAREVPIPALPSLSTARVAFIPTNSDTLGPVEVDMTTSPVLTSAAPTYDTVSRPFRQAVNRWTGFGLETQVIEVMFAGEWNPAMGEQGDVTDWVSSLHFLAQPPGGTTEPPLLRLEGPGVYGRGADERWQIVSVEQKPGTLISRSSDGRIGQIEYTVTLSKWFSSTLITIRSPAQKAKEAAGKAPVSAPAKTYTVASGDTLSRIAQRALGNANRWTELASLNGIRDPNKIKIGQVLKLP